MARLETKLSRPSVVVVMPPATAEAERERQRLAEEQRQQQLAERQRLAAAERERLAAAERQRLAEEQRQQQLAEEERKRDLQASVAQASNSDIFIPAEGEWTVYKNARFGTTLAFPSAVFDVLGPPQGSNGRRLNARAGDARIEVTAWNNVTPDALQNLRRRLMNTAGYEQVTYQATGDNWFVLSGFRGDAVFYEKYLYDAATGAIHIFSLSYPRERKGAYDAMLDRIEDSFQKAIKPLPKGRPSPSS